MVDAVRVPALLCVLMFAAGATAQTPDDQMSFEVASVKPTTSTGTGSSMRNLLKDRFHLEIRREERTITTYMLTIAKNGPKLKPAAEVSAEAAANEDHPVVGIFQHYADGKVTAQGRKQNIAKLLTWLTTLLGQPVLDETKLKGEYDWNLSWSPEDGNTSIFPAMQQQLGLKLEGRKAPVNMLLVLSALKTPTEN